MSFSDALRVIGELERQFDVDSVRYGGVCVWPIIRNALTASLENNNENTFRNPRNGKYNLWACLPDPAQLESFTKCGEIEYLFFTRWSEYKTRIQGHYYGFSDSYLEIVKDSHRVMKIELDSAQAQATLPRYYPTLFLKHTTPRLPCPIGTNDIENFQALRQAVLCLCSLDLDEGVVIEIVNNTEQYRLFFLDVLRRIRPKVVSMVCYYTCPMAMGLIRACRDLGITTVELKHGVIPNSPYYERWRRIPADGYEYLPDRFYVWGRKFQEDIDADQPTGCRNHRAIVGPNEWIRRSLQEPLPPIDGIDSGFWAELNRRSKVILITLGYPTDGIPNHVLEAMRSGPRDWLWLLRCHPQYQQKKEPFIGILAQHGIRNYEIERATDQPLVLLLSRVHAHLTRCSSSCMEALIFGVPSLIYAEVGYEFFCDYIQQGYLDYEPDSAENMLHWLHTHPDRETIRNHAKSFFTMDRAQGRQAFAELLEHAESRQPRLKSPRYRAANLNQMGRYHVGHGNLPAAIEVFAAAIRQEPADTEAYNNLGGICWHLGDHLQASRFIESAMEIDSSDPRTRQNWRQLQGIKSSSRANSQAEIEGGHSMNLAQPGGRAE